MYIDHENQLCNGQAITEAVASENIVDLGKINESATGGKAPAYNKKGNARLVVVAKKAAKTLATCTIALRTDGTLSGSAPSSYALASANTVFTKSFTKAQMAQGAVLIDQELPLGLEQYIDLYITPNTTEDQLELNAMIVLDSQSNGMNK